MADTRLDLIAELQDKASKKLDALTKKVETYSKSIDKAGKSSSSVEKSTASLTNKMGNLSETMGNIGVVSAGGLATMGIALDSSIKKFSEAQSSQLGFQATANKLNVDMTALNGAVQSLTADGLLPVTTAQSALQNLMQAGLTDVGSMVRLMTNFKDEAIFGKSASIDYATAVSNLAESFKTESSTLGNLSGISENYSMILEKGAMALGKKVDQLTEAERAEAKLIGLLQIGAVSAGNSALAQDTLAGAQARATKATTELQIALGEALAPALKKINDAITPLITLVTDWIKKNPELAGGIAITTTAVLALGVAIGGVSLLMTPALIAFGKFIAIMTVVAAGIGVLKVAWDNDFMGMRTTITWFGSQVEDTLQDIKETVNKYLPQIQQFWKDHGKTIYSIWTATFNGISTYTSGIVKAITMPIKNMFDTMLTLVRVGMKVLQGSFGEAWDEVRALTGRMLMRVVDAVSTMVGPFVEAGKSLITTLIAKFKDFFPEMYEIGKNLIQGMINGIQGMAGDAINAASNVASGAVQSVKNVLMIKSPSRVMMEIGEFTMEGLVIGMQNKKEEVRLKAEELAEQLTEAFVGLEESYKESGTRMAENFLDLNEKHTETMQKFRDEIKKTKDEITALEKGYTSFITGEGNKFGEMFVSQEEKVSKLQQELSVAQFQGEDSGKLMQLQGQLENEKRILEEARSFYLQGESDVKNKVQELEANLQYTVNQLRSATSVEDQARLQVRSENLQTQIDYMKERESTFATEQKTLAEGVERSRAMARMTEMEKYIFTMQQRRTEAKKEYDEKLAQKQQELKDTQDAMIKEVDIYVTRLREIHKIQNIMETQHKDMMERQTKVTLEEVNKQIEAYKRLAEASKNAVGGRISSFSTGGVVERFANGGMASGTDTVPAMLTPGEVILNASQQKNLASQLRSGGNGKSITININTMIGEEEFAEKMGAQIVRQLQFSTAF